MTKKFLWLLLATLIFGCQPKEKDTADVVFINGNIYTVNTEQPRAEAIAVKDGRILAIGANADIEKLKDENTEVIDLQGQFAMPGFIEGHGHFSGLGQSLMNLNFLKSRSWEEIVKMVEEKAKTAKPGEWIVGRGWHQEKWENSPDKQVLGYPYHDELSHVSPNNPVLLRHASGHGLFANKKAMELAGITAETPNPSGGEIVRDSRGEAIGVFEERAMGLVTAAYAMYRDSLSQEALKEEWLKGIELAQQECLAKGITSFQDAGSSQEEVKWYTELAEQGKFDLRLWAMIRHRYPDIKDKLAGLPIIDAGDGFFTCRAIKSEVDGALGSYGAWLLASYDDKRDFVGQNTTKVEDVEAIAKLCMDNGLQLCVHAIGDRANREVLNIMEKEFQANPNKKDVRWRIEHSQHIDLADIPRFAKLGVIAAMQGIHCTSDAPFVVKRLGEQRAREGAYPWRSLLDAGAIVTNGTDAPVEDVSPLESFYATVTRKRFSPPIMEFFPEQKMTREEGIKSYTWSCAYSAFEEQDKGSLEIGKFADIVVLSKDLVTCSEEEILQTEVLMTIVSGKVKYKK
ncbi:MAG: amidohydrolase [Saprospiraceae bacterium]|nr:amidohydrolase [Saprospiraceae bacterium]